MRTALRLVTTSSDVRRCPKSKAIDPPARRTAPVTCARYTANQRRQQREQIGSADCLWVGQQLPPCLLIPDVGALVEQGRHYVRLSLDSGEQDGDAVMVANCPGALHLEQPRQTR
jgi:hypothetical protein